MRRKSDIFPLTAPMTPFNGLVSTRRYGRIMRIIPALLACLIPSLAAATPPRVVYVDEDLLAVNDTHLFVLRTLSDNFGFYEVAQSDVLLIARNRETGADDQQWPVLSIRDNGRTFAEFEPTQDRVANLGLPERVNPYDVMLWRKARLPTGAGTVYDPERYDISDSAVRFSSYDDTVYMADLSETLILLNQSLKASRATIPFNPDAGLSSSTAEAAQIDPLLAWPLGFDDACQITHSYRIDVPAHATSEQFTVKIDCPDADQPFAVFVILGTSP